MKDEQEQPPKIISASNLLNTLFSETFSNEKEFDPEVVALVKEHLAATSPHTRAGSNLANALIDLAKNRAIGGKQE
ncbi:MAG: hypothetical protein IPM66_03520 [Acidobacteriota bacterium]|nr:MAG: hypothetical protein IPM66_03520 [Acidobacteriota bacterium]